MAPTTRRLLEITLPAHSKHLGAIREEIRKTLETPPLNEHFDNMKRFDASVVTSEAASNAIKHLNPGTAETCNPNTEHSIRIVASIKHPTTIKKGLLKIIIYNKYLGEGKLTLEKCREIAAKERELINKINRAKHIGHQKVREGKLTEEKRAEAEKKLETHLAKILGGRLEAARGITFMEELADQVDLFTNKQGEVETHLYWTLPRKGINLREKATAALRRGLRLLPRR